jgi:hypothetical protein
MYCSTCTTLIPVHGSKNDKYSLVSSYQMSEIGVFFANAIEIDT